MKKRIRLANKMTIMVCAVLLAVSAFFYAPMRVNANEIVATYNLVDSDTTAHTKTAYGLKNYVYVGSDFELLSTNTTLVCLDTNAFYYEDVISSSISLSTLNGSNVVLRGDRVRFSFNVELLVNSVIGSDADYDGLDLIYQSHVKECYFVLNGQKYFGNKTYQSGNTHRYQFNIITDVPYEGYSLGNYSLSCYVVTSNNICLDAFDVDNANYGTNYGFKAHWNVRPSVVFKYYVGNSSSPTGAINIYDYDSQEIVDYDIENQTAELNKATQEQTDTMVNGFDNTQGDNVNSDLSAGLDEYQTAEDSLFATATTGMKDFTFFDIESVPAMVTGISFITATMTGWFNQAGGASGVGIVLSILFSVMLVAMVLGLYRWYQSRGGKD